MVAPLFVQQTGRIGPAVILVHGLGASGRFWRLVAEALAGEARIFCPDLLGFGRSPRPPVAYTVADHIAALDGCLDNLALDGEQVVLAGHSTGAVLALAWAAARRERFSGLGLISLPVYLSAADARKHIAALSLMAWATVAQPALGELICSVMCASRSIWQRLLPLLMRDLPADMARDLALHDWCSYHNTTQNVLVTHRLTPSAQAVASPQLPVRFIHGHDDRTAPVFRAQQLAGQFHWPISVLDGCGHQLLVEAPEACAAGIRALLAGYAATGAGS